MKDSRERGFETFQKVYSIRAHDNTGNTSVFLCIILAALIFASFVAIDAARISSAEKQAAAAAGKAAKSALADYSSALKENFGLFATCKDNEELEKSVADYIAKTLRIGAPRKTAKPAAGLYDFKIEDIKVTPLFNFTENSTVESQILEYMKYRGPKEAVQVFIDKLTAVKDTSRMSELYSEKIDVDAALGKIDKTMGKIAEQISNAGGSVDFHINDYNLDGAREKEIELIAEEIISLRELRSGLSTSEAALALSVRKLTLEETAISDYEDYLEAICSKLDKSADELSETEVEILTQQRKVLVEKIEASSEIIENLKREIKSAEVSIASFVENITHSTNSLSRAWKTLREDRTSKFLESNRKALKLITDAEELIQKAKALADALKTLMSTEKFNGGELLSGIKDEINSELNSEESLLLDGKYLDEIKRMIGKNIDSLEKIEENLSQYDEIMKTTFDLPGDKSEIIESLTGDEEYEKIEFKFNPIGGDDDSEDPRNSAKSAANEVIEKLLGNTTKLSEMGLDPELLPSRHKVRSILEDQEQGADSEDSNSEGENSGDSDAGDSSSKADFKDSGAYSKGALDFTGSLGDTLLSGLEQLRDELFIDEYIIGTFSNNSKADKDKQKGLLAGEAEYVLHGKESDSTNLTLTKGEILLARFALNSLHVYMDKDKKTLAKGIATAAAGWWTGGAGIPIISNLIMCAWGMGEAVWDVNELLKGREIPFYKQKEDWKLKIGLGSGDNTGSPSTSLKFSYEDYLRLLLLTVSNEKKISRVEDLISMNLFKQGREYDMSKYASCIKVEAVLSVDYKFLSGILRSSKVKTTDGRHLIKVVLYEAY